MTSETPRIRLFQSFLMAGLAVMTSGSLVSAASAQRASVPDTRTAPVARRMTVTGHGEIMAKPDKADITIGVVTEDKASQAAVKANADQSAKVQTAVGVAGVTASDIQTVNYSVQPMMSSPQPAQPGQPQPKPEITGYRVYNEVRVTVRDLSKVGDVIDASTAAGANKIENIAFGLSDASASQDEALDKAVADARRKADRLARAAGVTIIGIYELNDSSQPTVTPLFAARAADATFGTPIASGELTVTANVTIVYQMSGELKSTTVGKQAPIQHVDKLTDSPDSNEPVHHK